MAYRHTSGYSLDALLRWIDLVLLTIFFLFCTEKGPAVPDLALIRLWEGGILVLLVYLWKCIFSFMHTERSSTLYEAWKDIIIRNSVAVTLGWVTTLLCILLLNSAILLLNLPGNEIIFFQFSTTRSALTCFGFLLLFFLLYRISVALVLRKKDIKQQPLSYALIVGGLNVRSHALAENLRRKESGYKLLGFADTLAEEDAQHAKALNVVCSLQGVEEYITTHRVDEIFLTLPVRSFYDEIKSIIQYGLSMGLTVRVLNDLFTFETGTFDYIDGDLAYFTADSPLPSKEENIQISIKFLVEKIIAFCALIFCVPLFLVVWGLNFFHWPFSLKEYIGLNKKTFRMVQFNDMRAITFLQKRGIRNVPRLINILLGDMSIIGPKPVPQGIQMTDAYKTLDQRRFVVKPGLFSPHSIKKEDGVPQDEDIQVELDYIASQDFLSDCKILINLIKNS